MKKRPVPFSKRTKKHRDNRFKKIKICIATLKAHWKSISIAIALCTVAYTGLYFFNSPIDKIERMTVYNFEQNRALFYFENNPENLKKGIDYNNIDEILSQELNNYLDKFAIPADMTWAEGIKNSPLIQDYRTELFTDEVETNGKVLPVNIVKITFKEKSRDVYYLQYIRLYSPFRLPFNYRIYDSYGYVSYARFDSEERSEEDLAPIATMRQFFSGNFDTYPGLIE